MALTDVELLARMIQCEADGQGETVMKAVAAVIMNRLYTPGGLASHEGAGGLADMILESQAFECVRAEIGGRPNPNNIYNLSPESIHYEIAQWALGGGRMGEVGDSLWFFNPHHAQCPACFPHDGSGVFHTRIHDRCFYRPAPGYEHARA